MRITPFFVPGNNQHNTPMGIDYHIVPGVHALFFGPIECARHTFPQLVEDPDASLLVVNDVQTSLGATEDLVREAVEEISAADPKVRAFLFCTACQTAFMGIDLEGLCLDLHAETGLYFGHVEANRMSAENIPGRARKDIAGGDRYHSRLALFRMLRQVPGKKRQAPILNCEKGTVPFSQEGGVLFLTGDGLDTSNEVLGLTQVPGIDWVRGMGDCRSFEDFLQLRNARVTVATSMPWKEVGEWMRDEFGIPTLYLPTSYSLEEVEGYYEELLETLGQVFASEAHEELAQFREECGKKRESAKSEVERALAACPSFDLDARLINRPFSLLETLFGYGFQIYDFVPPAMRVLHKEADDLPAFERLGKRYPYLAQRFAARPKSSDRKKGGTRTKNLRRAGRWVNIQGEGKAERVPEETAWWGYASVSELMRQIEAGAQNLPGRGGLAWGQGPQPRGERPQGRGTQGRKGRWSL